MTPRLVFMVFLAPAVSWLGTLWDSTSAEEVPSGQFLIVAPDGTGAYTEIQAAIDAAKPGDTIMIRPGAYREDVVVHSKDHVRLVGESRDRVIIQGLKRVGALRVGKWPYGANDIEVRDMTISENGGLAVGVFNGARILLSNLRVQGLLYVQQAKEVRIERSLLGGSQTTGVSFADAQGELLGNEIRDNDHGVSVAGKSSVRVTSNVILNNLFEGLVVESGARAEIVRNTIVKNGGGIALHGTARADVAGNIIGANKAGILVAPEATARLAFNALFNDGPDYARPGQPPMPAPELRPSSDVTVDPHFVNPTAGDFRLRPDSPLVRRGQFEYLGALPPVPSPP